MYLEKLVIQGFKSFASRNELVFPGGLKEGKHGLTAIVGPNGSGKSNVADAVRWALGEQSMKTLRGKKSEDIIFSGSDKRGQLGMAEVSLHLNNADGGSGIEFSEVVITRRLYRDGASEYFLNGTKVRLFEIQMMLAKANFGQKTYSVIGQGMVESFLNTSLAERKEFFDEATGVKQYQIKREDALNKLRASIENLAQSQMLVAEIEPRLKTLAKQIARLEKKEQLLSEQDHLQLNYYASLWQQLSAKLTAVKEESRQTQDELERKRQEIAILETELAGMSGEQTVGEEFDQYGRDLSAAREDYSRLTKHLENLAAWLKLAGESQARLAIKPLEEERLVLEEKLAAARTELAATQQQADRRPRIAELGNLINALERDRADLLREMHRLDAWIEMKLESIGKFDLAFLTRRKTELSSHQEKINNEIAELEVSNAGQADRLTRLQGLQADLAAEIKKINAEWREVSAAGESESVREVNNRLERSLAKLTTAEAEHDLAKLRAVLAEIRQELAEAMSYATGKETQRRLARLSQRLQEAAEHKEKAATEISDLQLALNTGREKKRMLAAQAEQLVREAKDVDSKLAKADDKFDDSAARTQRIDINRQQEAKGQEIIKLSEELNSLRLADEKKRTAYNSARQQVESLERESGRLLNSINETKMASARLEARREELERVISLQSAELSFDLSAIDIELQAAGEQAGALKKTIDELTAKIADFNALQEAKRRKLVDLQRSLQHLQNEANRLSASLNEASLTAVRHETRLEDLEAEIHENYDHLERIKTHQVGEAVNHEEMAAKIKNLRRQLESIGSLDEDVEKEYLETKERFEFLSGQVNDLVDTIKSLEEIIRELDETIRARFDKEFDNIASKFEEYFKILFNGGTAKIIKVMSDELDDDDKPVAMSETEIASRTEPDSPIAGTLKKLKTLAKINATGLAGIEIVATPPGKKIKSISMLSGGERALTAIALISAIISANPSPFVVLDEVDAALDEANSERLAQILEDLSHKTQFIVITHNRAPMRKAAILYGVTMQDDGISKLLSVKLEDVKINNR
ncbi:MAG: AAA family ATPase [Candidatus Falkowbacteria bacterium]